MEDEKNGRCIKLDFVNIFMNVITCSIDDNDDIVQLIESIHSSIR